MVLKTNFSITECSPFTFTCIQLFRKTLSEKNKKPISQDCKVIWEFLKLANNAASYSKDLLVARETTQTTLWSWLMACLLFLLTTFFEIAVYIYFIFSTSQYKLPGITIWAKKTRKPMFPKILHMIDKR